MLLALLCAAGLAFLWALCARLLPDPQEDISHSASAIHTQAHLTGSR